MHCRNWIWISLSSFLICCAPTRATETELQIESLDSSVDSTITMDVTIPGSLIGDFDPATNPGGTSTLPGLFGGQGNQPIPLDIAGNLSGEINSQPSGSYRLDVDLDQLTVEISEFTLDLLGGEPGVLQLSADLDFETFRTVQPDSLFLGVPLSLPLGDSVLNVLRFEQNGLAAPSVLIPAGKDTFVFGLLVPINIEVEAEIFGQPLEPMPFPLALLLSGELVVNGNDISVSQTFDQSFGDKLTDVAGLEFTDVPFPVPTILPPGNTANLLISGSVASFGFDIGLIANIVAGGSIDETLPGDINGDGEVNLLDVQPFVDLIVSGQFQPEADINGDGKVNLKDVAAFVELIIG